MPRKGKQGMRKKVLLIIAIFLSCVLLAFSVYIVAEYVKMYRELSPKGTITHDDNGDITYNGRKYIDIGNTNGKIHADYDTAECVKIATMPWDSLALLGVSVFYGDDVENPDLIVCNRGGDVWVRKGLDIDELIMNNNCVVSDDFSFRICDVITEEVIPYSIEQKYGILHHFQNFPLNDYPGFNINDVRIVKIDGDIYLQYVWDSDFYKITEQFEADLYKYVIIE